MGLITINAGLPYFDGVLKAVEQAGRNGLPYTKQAVRAATVDVVQRTWIEYASGVTVSYSGGTFRINVVSGDYIRSIQDGLRFPDDLTGEVFSTAPHAGLIEDGQEPHDMKPGLLNSPKAKPMKGGGKYLTVPFRHGTPGTTSLPAMPKDIYKVAKKLGFSRKRTKRDQALTGRKYEWNGRLSEDLRGKRTHTQQHPGHGYTWKSGQYAGMVRMGKQKHGQYLTFRRVSTNSDPNSWMHPGVKPKPIREAVVENTREEVLALIRQGFEMDLYFMGIGGDD